MRIIELVESQDQIDEISARGVGQGIGQAAGGVVRGAGDFFKGIKRGYQAGRAPADNVRAAPATVDQIRSQITQKQREIRSLQSQISQNEPGIGQATNTVSGTASNTPQPQTTAPTAAPPTEPGIGQAAGSIQATSSNTAPSGATPAEIRQQKQAAAAVAAQNQMAAPPTTRSATAPTLGTKLTPQQVAAKKAELGGRRQAGTSTATQTGSGFKNYTAGSGQRMTGVDAKGAPVFRKIQRENTEFYSNFLGRVL